MEHTFKQAVKHKKADNLEKGHASGLSWWQLSLIGIGSVIGAGFFLGTGLSIKTAGPAILINYLVAGFTAFLVFSAIAEMTVADPQPGSFRTYAKLAFGNSMGFVSGWVYWIAGIFIMSSEAVALGTFTKFWFPHIPLWIFTAFFVAAAFAINLLGVKNFGKIESLFAIVKLSTLVIFIFFGLLLLFHMISLPTSGHLDVRNVWHPMFPRGTKGMWAALIFVFFSFGGIEVMGVASSELKKKEEITKAGTVMLLSLVAVYLLSIFFVFYFVSWTKINETESPFVTALANFNIPYIDSIFNLIIISAAFSTMVGALFSVTNILISLAEDQDAPKSFARKNQKGTPIRSLLVTGIALTISLIFSFILPGKLYEYITTAAGVMLILNWIIILSTHLKLRKNKKAKTAGMPGSPYTSYLAIALILLTVSGGFVHATQRMGVLISLGLIVFIFLLSYLLRGKRKKSIVKG
jgi:L-asparagine transporter-like permease